MKKLSVLLFICGCAFFAGCASQKVRTSNETGERKTLPPESVSEVPLPEQTPYDSNPELRTRYLRGYAGGYGFGIRGLAASVDIAGSRENPEWSQAYIEGNLAGQEAGSLAREAKTEKKPNQTPEPMPLARPGSS